MRVEGMSGGQGAPAQGGGSGACALAKGYASTVSPLVDNLKARTTELGNQYVTGKSR